MLMERPFDETRLIPRRSEVSMLKHAEAMCCDPLVLTEQDRMTPQRATLANGDRWNGIEFYCTGTP